MKLSSTLSGGIAKGIRAYQRVLSPLFGQICRFEPSCSQYALTCFEKQTLFRASLLTVWRLCKCHPFHRGGYDPPPFPAGSALNERTIYKESVSE